MKKLPLSALGLALGLAFTVSLANGGELEGTAFGYNDYAIVLKNYVDEKGMVNYKELKGHRQRLDAFVSAMANLDPSTYRDWSEKQKIAFWINAYNALVLKTIIDHYPIKPSLFMVAIFPSPSIRHISGVFDRLPSTVMGRPMVLNDIEHETLRKNFNEPRIHVSLVCASIGCPPLRGEPFEGEELDTQLADQARRFLSSPRNFRIDRSRKKVYLSSIFKWFGKDFVRSYGTDEKFERQSRTVRAVLNFVSKYVSPQEQSYLAKGTYSIHYTEYDWSLNEQEAG